MKNPTHSLPQNKLASLKRALFNSLCVSTGLALAMTITAPATSLAQTLAPASGKKTTAPNTQLVLPTVLPPKAPVATTVPAQVTQLPAKAVVVKVTKKAGAKKTASKPKKDVPEGVATTLPAFKGTKRIVINFDTATEPKQPTVVVRTELPLERSAADKAKAQDDAKNSATVTVVKPAIQAIPSATYIEVAEGGGDDPTAASTQQATPKKETPVAVTAALPVKSPEPDPELQAVLEASVPAQEKAEPVSTHDSSSTSVTTTVTVVPPANAKNLSVSIADPVPTDEEFVSRRTEKKRKGDQTISANEPAADEPPLQEAKPAPALAASSPGATHGLDLSSYRLHLRTGYLDARYSRLEDRLQNGATSIGAGLSRDLGEFEARVAFDMLHGLDQSVSAQNIRMSVARAEVARMLSSGSFRPFISGGLGLADYNVRSYRSTSDSLITLKEHAKGLAITLIPAAGLRSAIGQNLTLDLQAEYIALIGSNAPEIGGVSGAASLGFGF